MVTSVSVPFVSLADAANENPDPSIERVDVPDAVTVGESFQVTVEGRNNGGRGGHYSTISISSPTLDSSSDGDQLSVVDGSDHAYATVATAGDTIYTKAGNQKVAEYALAEAGADGSTYWGAGESRDLTVEFTPEQTGTFVIYVRVTMPDDDDQEEKFNAPGSSATEDQQNYEVRRYEVEVREETNVDAQIESFQVDTGTYTAGDTVTAETEVTNIGNREHTFYVGYSFIGPNGEAYSNDGSTHEPVTLQPGETDTVQLEWTVPEGAPTGEYEAITSVWKRESDGKLYDRYDSASEQGVEVVSGTPEASITGFDPPSGEYTPGDRVTASVTVENTGNVESSFWVDGSAYTPDGTWALGIGETIQLGPNEDRTIQVSWTIPEDAQAGSYGFGAAVYASDAKESVLDTIGRNDQFEVVAPEPTAEFGTTEFASGTYRPGDPVTSTVVIRNTGEVDHEFIVGYSAIGPENDEYTNDDSTHERIFVPAGEEREITLRWDVPTGAPAGSYDLVASIWKSETADGLEGRVDRASRSDAIEVTTDAQGRIGSVEYPSGTVEPGDVVETNVYVENTGTSESTFYVGYAAVGPDGDVYDNDASTHEEVTVDGNDGRWVTVTWTVPADAPAGEYDLHTGLWQSQQGDDLVGKLDRDTSTDAIAIQSTSLSVVDVTVSPENPQPDSEVTVAVTLTNDGETDVSGNPVKFELGDRSTTRSTDIPAGETTTVEATLDTGDVDSETLTVTVDRPSDEPLTITRELTYTAESAVVRGTVHTPDGDPISDARITIGDTETRTDVDGTFEVTDLQPGEYTLTVETGREKRTRELEITAGEERDIELTVGTAAAIERIQAPESIPAGETVSIQVVVRNLGTTSETFTVGISDMAGVELPNGASERTISGDSTRTVKLDVRLTDAFSGEPLQLVVTDDTGDVVAEGTHSIARRQTGLVLTIESEDGTRLSDTRVRIGDSTYRTNVSGMVTITELDAGEYSAAIGPDADPYATVDVTIPAERTASRTITVTQGRTLEVTLVDGDTPIADASVELFGTDRELTARSDSDGTVQFSGLEPGTYTVYVTGDSVRDDVLRDVTVREDRTVEIEAEAMPDAEPVAISGRIITESGDPASDVTVDIQGRTGGDTLTTNSDGTFESEAIFQPGVRLSVRVKVDGDLYKWRHLTPDRAGGSYTITIPDSALAGRKADDAADEITDASSPQETLNIYASYASASVKQAVFSGVTPDTYRFDELYGVDSESDSTVDYTSPCADMAVTASTSCLAYSNQVKHDRSISHYGAMLGVAKGLTDSIDAIKNLPQALIAFAEAITNPIETIAGVIEAAIWLGTHPEALDDIVDQLPQSVINAQQADNPFPEGTEDHRQFADAWYTGYVVYFATELVATGAAGKAAKGTKAASRFGDNLGTAKAYLKTVAGRDRLTTYIRNPRLLDSPREMDSYTKVIKGTGSKGQTFRSTLSKEELALFLKLEDTVGIPRGRLEQFVRLSGRDGAEFVSQVLSRGDSEMLRWLFKIDETDGSIDWDEWRRSVASKYAVSKPNKENIDRPPVGASHDELKEYVGAVYRVSESDKIRGHEEYVRRFNDEEVSRDGREGYTDTMSSITSEAKTALDYARRDDVDDIITEPELQGTDKDIDVYVRYADGSSDYIEAKEWTVRLDSSRGENLEDHLFSSGNAVNKKFDAATDVDGNRVAELVIKGDHSRDDVQAVIEEVIRERDGDINFDEIRIRYRGTDRDVWTGTIDGDTVSWSRRSDSSSSLTAPSENDLSQPSLGGPTSVAPV